jgi:hypothetical protein
MDYGGATYSVFLSDSNSRVIEDYAFNQASIHNTLHAHRT